MTNIPLEIGACFFDDSSGIPISIMIVGYDYPIYLISIRTICNKVQLICQFAPVHKTILDNFLKKSRYVGIGKPNQVSTDEDIKLWKDSNSGHKTYFTIPLEEIFAICLSSAKLNTDKLLNAAYALNKDGIPEPVKVPTLLLPTVFPGTDWSKNQEKPGYEYLDMGVVGNTMVDHSLN